MCPSSKNAGLTGECGATVVGKARDAQTDTLHNTSCELILQNPPTGDPPLPDAKRPGTAQTKRKQSTQA